MEKVRKKKIKTLINRAEIKSYIKRRVQDIRPGWKCTCVSNEFLDNLNADFQVRIDRMIKSHPTVGKTFKEYIW